MDSAAHTGSAHAVALPNLLAPLRIGAMTVPNRVVMAPHSTHYADRIESARLTDYYVERARGGVGLIIHEPVVVHPSSLTRVGKIWGYLAENAEAYRRTTDAVHAHGTKIVCQLIHNGRQVDGYASQLPAWYPSEMAKPGSADVTHAMSTAEIAEVVAGFASAAQICHRGGFDGIEIHAAHGYLLQAFLSPATNTRTDEYGGTLANRVRIVREVVTAVRQATDPAFVVGVRLTGDEFDPAGLGADECVEIAALLAGTADGVDPIDYVSVVSGNLASYDRIVPDGSFERGLNVALADRIRARVAPLPVLVTGRIAEPEQAEQILAAGQADLVGMARALIADPHWLRKAAAGDFERIRPCVYANECRDSIGARRSLTCTVNPAVGREGDAVDARTGANAGAARRVVVIGGGVAGMQAALSAAEHGDQVVLFEMTQQLGGQLRLAAAPQSRRELRRLEAYLSGGIEAAGVDVRLGTRATPDQVAGLAPDLIVVATGARGMPAGEGVSAWDVLSGARVPDGPVVAFDRVGGNGWPFFAAVEVLAEAGRQVIVVCSGAALGSAVEGASLPPLLGRFRQWGVEVNLLATASSSDSHVTIRRQDTGAERSVAGATLVVETGRRARIEDDFTGLSCPVVVVGDALAPRRVGPALSEARAAVTR